MDHECVCVCVLQISSRVICDRILVLVRDGFLQQVIGPALFQVLTLNTHTHTRTHTHTLTEERGCSDGGNGVPDPLSRPRH